VKNVSLFVRQSIGIFFLQVTSATKHWYAARAGIGALQLRALGSPAHSHTFVIQTIEPNIRHDKARYQRSPKEGKGHGNSRICDIAMPIQSLWNTQIVNRQSDPLMKSRLGSPSRRGSPGRIGADFGTSDQLSTANKSRHRDLAGFFETLDEFFHAARRSFSVRIVCANQAISFAASLCGSASMTASPRAALSA
jgi:hypothetical protein